MKTIRFGIIGCGVMGRALACAIGNWCRLTNPDVRPELVAVCSPHESSREWFMRSFPSIRYSAADYRELLVRDDIDAIYCAVPNDLHEQIYTDTIRAGKHLLGEKPFGIDLAANTAILKTAAENPTVFVRCVSQFAFYPAAQALVRQALENRFGRLIEVRAGFNHASDLDLQKPINWKRTAAHNGRYGCMGDLGMHILHIPFRLGWLPEDVYALLSDLVPERPDQNGVMVPCDTIDNAMLLCNCKNLTGDRFPLYLETKRLSPGSTNEWYLKVLGMDGSACFSTDDPNAFHTLSSGGKTQAWARTSVGYHAPFPTVSDGNFEFGFSDALLQMLAAFLHELAGYPTPFCCVTPDETRLSHLLMTAALSSHEKKRAVRL